MPRRLRRLPLHALEITGSQRVADQRLDVIQVANLRLGQAAALRLRQALLDHLVRLLISSRLVKRAGALKNDAKRILLRDLILLGFRAEFKRRGGVVQLLLQLDLVVLVVLILVVLVLIVLYPDGLPPPARPEIEKIVGVILLSLLALAPTLRLLGLGLRRLGLLLVLEFLQTLPRQRQRVLEKIVVAACFARLPVNVQDPQRDGLIEIVEVRSGR